jgi:hypothetical protein
MPHPNLDLNSAKTLILSQISSNATLIINNKTKLKMVYKDNGDGTISVVTNEINKVSAKKDEKGYVYFVFDATGSMCLYVGKSNDLKKRLREHLVKPSKSTNSKYEVLHKFILDGATTLYFDYIKIDPSELYGAAEGQFISYFEDIHTTNGTLKKFWNIRHD